MKLKNNIALLCLVSLLTQTVFSGDSGSEALVPASGSSLPARLLAGSMGLVKNEPLGTAAVAVGSLGFVFGAVGLANANRARRRAKRLEERLDALASSQSSTPGEVVKDQFDPVALAELQVKVGNLTTVQDENTRGLAALSDRFDGPSQLAPRVTVVERNLAGVTRTVKDLGSRIQADETELARLEREKKDREAVKQRKKAAVAAAALAAKKSSKKKK